MKRFFKLIFVAIIAFSLSSCAYHNGLTGNMNSHTTNVILEKNNYRIVERVEGSAKGIYYFGFGGPFKPLVARARVKMLESAKLLGSSKAVINETVEVNGVTYFGIVSYKTVTVSGYVIEFIY